MSTNPDDIRLQACQLPTGQCAGENYGWIEVAGNSLEDAEDHLRRAAAELGASDVFLFRAQVSLDDCKFWHAEGQAMLLRELSEPWAMREPESESEPKGQREPRSASEP